MLSTIKGSLTPGLSGRLKTVLEKADVYETRRGLITKEREQKGDLDCRQDSSGKRVTLARQRDITVLAHAVQVRWIEAWHASYGLGYQELRHAWTSPLSLKSNSIYLAQIYGSVPGTNYASEMYQSVFKMLGKVREHAVLFACQTQWVDGMLKEEHKNFMVQSFDRLIDCMDVVRKEKEESKNNG